jgi:predicted nucleic acid-binding Zn ribbon protein
MCKTLAGAQSAKGERVVSSERCSNRGRLKPRKREYFLFLCALLLVPVSVLLSQEKNIAAEPDFVLLVTGENDGRVEPCG